MIHRVPARPKRVQVLSSPGQHHAQNSYFSLLWQALKEAGAEMIAARSMAPLRPHFDILQVHIPEDLCEVHFILL
jgi:hypothetical protein